MLPAFYHKYGKYNGRKQREKLKRQLISNVLRIISTPPPQGPRPSENLGETLYSPASLTSQNRLVSFLNLNIFLKKISLLTNSKFYCKRRDYFRKCSIFFFYMKKFKQRKSSLCHPLWQQAKWFCLEAKHVL